MFTRAIPAVRAMANRPRDVRGAMLIRSFDQQQERRRYIVRDEQDTYVRAYVLI